MRKLPFPLVAAFVVVVVLAALHLAGILVRKNPVRVQVENDIESANNVFDTIDVKWATGAVTFDPPKMLNPPDVIPPLLKYPPSSETLAQMTGGF